MPDGDGYIHHDTRKLKISGRPIQSIRGEAISSSKRKIRGHRAGRAIPQHPTLRNNYGRLDGLSKTSKQSNLVPRFCHHFLLDPSGTPWVAGAGEREREREGGRVQHEEELNPLLLVHARNLTSMSQWRIDGRVTARVAHVHARPLAWCAHVYEKGALRSSSCVSV